LGGEGKGEPKEVFVLRCEGCGKQISETAEELTFRDYLVHYARVGHDPSFIQGKYLETESGKFWHAECYFGLKENDSDDKGVLDTLWSFFRT